MEPNPALRTILEKLQIASLVANGLVPEPFSSNVTDAFFERGTEAILPDASLDKMAQLKAFVADERRNAYANSPTPYEDPMLFLLLTELATATEESLREMRLPVPARPQLGSLPTGQINALTMRVPGVAGELVLFESELITFALLLSKAVCRALPFVSNDGSEVLEFSLKIDGVRHRVDSDPTVLQRFAEVVLAYGIAGLPAAAPQYFPEPHYAHAARYLYHTLELFVMGHEYSHIVLGHLDEAPRKALRWTDEHFSIDYSWDLEYIADRLGLILLLHSARREGLDLSLSYWGADFFFSAIDVMDRTVSLLETGDENLRKLGSHPPSTERRKELRKALTEVVVGATDKERDIAAQVEAALDMSAAVEAAVEYLWSKCRPIVARAHANGARPARSWSAAMTSL